MSENFPSDGEYVRQVRQILGLTREALADRLHCSVNTVRNVENGQQKLGNRRRKIIEELEATKGATSAVEHNNAGCDAPKLGASLRDVVEVMLDPKCQAVVESVCETTQASALEVWIAVLRGKLGLANGNSKKIT